MSDDDFERTVEELYSADDAHKPPGALPADRSLHMVELHAARNPAGAVDTQPRPRRSMEAPGRRSNEPRPDGDANAEVADERERAMLDARKDAKSRTREWVATHGTNANPSAHLDTSRAPSRQSEHEQQQRTGSHRSHRSEPNALQGVRSSSAHRQRASEAHADRHDHPLPHAQRPRLGIPSSLMPGQATAAAPAQLPFDLGPGQDRTSPTATTLAQGAVSSSSARARDDDRADGGDGEHHHPEAR